MAESRRLKVGVIGLGFGRYVHLQALNLLADVEVTAVSARTKKTVDEVCIEEKIANGFTNPLDLIRSKDVDAVVMAVPPNSQPELLRAALEMKKHVFLEKPVGGGEAQAAKLARDFHSSGLVHMIDFEFCELPPWVSFKDQISKIGHLRQINVAWNSETVSQKNFADKKIKNWKVDPSVGGGTLNNLGSHTLHYLEYFFGPMSELFCSLDGGKSGEDVVVRMLVKWADFVGEVVIATDCPGGNGHRIEVHGSEGSLRLENTSKDYMRGFELFHSTREGRTNITPHEPSSSHADGRVQAVHRLLERWVQAIQKRQTIKPNLTEGARVEYLIDQCRLSNKNQSWQRIGKSL
jgi:predicted dehydrogenase